MKTLIWSVAWGDYKYMLQSLTNSIRTSGIDYDVLTFSDEPLVDTFSCELDKNIDLDFKQYWKFHYLKKIQSLNYDIFVFIDSDHYFVRKPSKDFVEILGSDPWHSFLEGAMNAPTTRRGDWWGVKNQEMVQIFREFGVYQKDVYSTNGGFWICKKSFIEQAANVAFLFRDFQKSKGHDLPEEVAISVLSHLFSEDYSKRFHSRYHDIWASEWTGVLKDKMPDGSFWDFQEYMTNERINVNPAIVHAMRSKNALVENGKKIFEETKDERFFVSWEDVIRVCNRVET